MNFLTILVWLGVPRLVQGVVANFDGKQHRLRNGFQTAQNGDKRCPGLGSPCTGNGECQPTTGICMCKYGWGGTDCSQSVPKIYEVTYVRDDDRQDMLGFYDMVPMYLQEGPGDPAHMNFVAYDPLSKGWIVSKLNSSCKDDICFFAQAEDMLQPPPPKGYVFGNVDKHFYYKQLIFDDHDLFPGKAGGYHLNVAYTPDPNLKDIPSDLTNLTGRYVVQPRFIHQKTGKYAIMPTNLKAPEKLWVFLELTGTGLDRHWRILADATDPSINRYTVPKGPWMPPEMMLTLKPSCKNHITLDSCFQLQSECKHDTRDGGWVRACCRQTCNTCTTPASDCHLPQTAKGVAALLQRLNRTSLDLHSDDGEEIF